MPQDQTGHTTDRQATEVVVDELRVLIRDVRAWLEVMPIRTTAIADDTKATWGAASGTAELDLAVAAFDFRAAELSVAAEHAATLVQERAKEIDSVLAEIRRVRAETAAA
jgi:hypothetical protein